MQTRLYSDIKGETSYENNSTIVICVRHENLGKDKNQDFLFPKCSKSIMKWKKKDATIELQLLRYVLSKVIRFEEQSYKQFTFFTVITIYILQFTIHRRTMSINKLLNIRAVYCHVHVMSIQSSFIAY